MTATPPSPTPPIVAPPLTPAREGLAHLLSFDGVFAHPVTVLVTAAVAGALLLAPLVAIILQKAGKLPSALAKDIWTRYRTWLILAPAILVPILLCPLAAMLMVCAASILCYREYARATGLFRHRTLSAIVVVGILGVTLAAIDHWRALFAAMTPLTVVAVAVAAILPDQPKGYLQRVSLAVMGFLLFGAGLGNLSFLANDPNYRPILCLLILCTQASDIAAYCVGKSIGRRRLFPSTSPNKTLEGHLGAMLIVAPLCALLAHSIFRGSPMDGILPLAVLGLVVAIGAQMGDLMLGSIKRDLGIKDMAATLPGHGGFLDRFNSVLLVAPAAFHLISYMVGVAPGREPQVFTSP